MQKIGKKIREARLNAGLKQIELGQKVGLSQSAVVNLEQDNSRSGPDANLIVNLSEILEAPSLLQAYCEACPVCTALLPLHYPTLDNVALHPVAVADKLEEEHLEAAAAAKRLKRIWNLNGWANDPDTHEKVVEMLVQIRDADVARRVLYEVLFLRGLLPIDVLEEVNRRQEQKCIERGYCKPNGTEG